MKDCDECGGSGYGTCANCGDDWRECSCDDPQETECSQCDGTGDVMEEVDESTPDDE